MTWAGRKASFSKKKNVAYQNGLNQISLLPLAYYESSTCLVSLGIIICSETNHDLDRPEGEPANDSGPL